MCDFLNPQHISAMRLEQVVEICSDPKTGISNCIFLNREIFRLLQEKTPELFEMGRCPWIESWLEKQDIFLVDLSRAIGLSITPWPFEENFCQWYAPAPLREDEKEMFAAVLATCDKSSSRIFKRIDENRQLLETLRLEIPDLLKANMEIEKNIEHLDVFFNDIAHALELKQQVTISDADYPRPWPGTGDVASRYQKYPPPQAPQAPQGTELNK